MTKEEFYEKYDISEEHNKWESIDDWVSVEIYRAMHDGELPPREMKSYLWMTEFYDRIGTLWFIKEIMSKPNWGSYVTTCKRLIYHHQHLILGEINGKQE